MKKWKKQATLLLSLLMTVSFAVGLAACGSNSTNNTSSEPSDCLGSSSTPNSSSPDDNGNNENEEIVYPEITQVENPEAYTWSEYELVSEPTCSVAGVKQRRWTEDESVIHQEYIIPRGHTYENGICECGFGPLFPDAGEVSYAYPQESSSGIAGKGEEYDRYQLTEGYYEIECGRAYTWLSFAISKAGQYALYTVGDADDSVEIDRYDASAQYIPRDGNGNYINFPARELENGCLYSSISCSTDTWSEHWRATYSVKGKAGTVVKLRFVRIADEAWSPKTVRVQHLAKQIEGKHAPRGDEGTTPTVVPYETEYYYEESSGYYRMGSPSNPGGIIYAAITSIPPRMLFDKAFTQIQYEAASNLYLSFGKTVDGDYLVRDYLPFISGDTDNDLETDVENCYKNYVNIDGLYPVNQELFEFLNLYVQKNSPMEIPDEIKQDTAAYAEKAWLAACYYYKNLTPGSKEFPIALSGTGELTVSCPEYDFRYYTYTHENSVTVSTISYCTITCNDPNAVIEANGKQYQGKNGVISFIAETNAAQAFRFAVSSRDGSAAEFTLTVTENYQGSQDHPTTVNVGKGEQTVSFTTIEHLLASGEITYQSYYALAITEDGILNLSALGGEQVYMTVSYVDADGNDKDVPFHNWTPLEVKAGDVITIIVGPANGALSYDVNVSLS